MLKILKEEYVEEEQLFDVAESMGWLQLAADEGEAAQASTLRWEDYTTTAMDPSDDCTVWYVGDYLKKGAASYSTKIGAFRMRGCHGSP